MSISAPNYCCVSLPDSAHESNTIVLSSPFVRELLRIFLHRFLKRFFPDPPPVQWFDTKVLLLGLDGAGKTSIVRRFLEPEKGLAAVAEPTSGFDVRTVTVPPDVKLEIWEVGGASAIRPFWGRYADASIDALVWVVDGADASRLAEAATELAGVLQRAPRLRAKPLLVLHSKADLPAAQSADAIADALGLGAASSDMQRLRSGPLRVQATSALDGRGLTEALQWMNDIILGREAVRLERT